MAAAAAGGASGDAKATPAAAAAAPAPAKDIKDLTEREQLWCGDLKEALSDTMKLAASDAGWTSEGADSKTHALTVLSRSATTNVKDYAAKAAPHFTSSKATSYKIFMCRAYFAVTSAQMFAVLRDVPGTLTWNPTMIAYRVVKQLTEAIDVNTCVSASAAAGMISSREFIGIRNCSLAEGSKDTYIVAGCSVVLDASPLAITPTKGVIRGWNGAGGYHIAPVKGREQDTLCQVSWIVNADLKGWLPRSLIDPAMSSAMVDWSNNLRKHLLKCHPTQKYTIKDGQIVLTP